jgi:hypothetical protein
MVASEAQGTQPPVVQSDESEVVVPERGAERRSAQERARPAVDARRSALDAANRALTLASLALSPEQADRSDPTLTRLLLREAFIRVGRAAAPEDPQTVLPFAGELMNVRRARAAIEARADLPTRLKRPRLLDLSLELEGEAAVERGKLRELEAWLADLLRFLADEPAWFRTRWFRAVALALLGLLVVFIPRLFGKPSWFDYKWRASSTHSDYAISGTLGASAGAEGAFFHTNEQQGPWLLIDMNAARSIREIEVKNRTDCCFERALPLIAEVSTDGKSFSLVGWRDKVFAEWTVRFEPRVARYVRLRADANTYLHFAGVAIR